MSSGLLAAAIRASIFQFLLASPPLVAPVAKRRHPRLDMSGGVLQTGLLRNSVPSSCGASGVSKRLKRLPFQAWIYHCHLYPLQAYSRRVVDEDDLKLCGEQNKRCGYFQNISIKKSFYKTHRCKKLSHSSEMQNYALIHREGLKG